MPGPNEDEKKQGGEGTNPLEEKLDSISEKLSSLDKLDERISGLEQKIEQPKEPEQEVQEEEPDEDWKPNTWKDVREEAKNISERTLEEKLAERERQEKEKRDEEIRQKQEINAMLDEQVETLEKEGVLPEVKDRDDENDPGRKMRTQLFGYAAKLNTANLIDAANTVKEMNNAGMEFDPRANKWIRVKTNQSGKEAPVGSSSGTTTNKGESKISPKDIRKLDFDGLIDRYME